MALELVREAPEANQYTSLEEHQAQTPGTFFGGKPVLYHQLSNATLSIDSHQLTSSAAFSSLRPGTSQSSAGANTAPTNGDAQHASTQEEIPGLDIWVASDYFTLFSAAASTGIRIPYPTISLHAQQSNALYMQLCLSDISQTADEDLETLELLLTPPATAAPAPSTEEGSTAPQSPAQSLYAAVSACADLHPDPDSSEDGEGQDAEDTAPGAGGWITSDNMADFMDEDGNFVMPSSLGAGAGSVRTAEQFEDAPEDGMDGEDSKWRRTE
ncbi:hypothetical protein MBLNU459_g1511t1 [Dothideomycetes sp. NU459]